MRRLRAGTNVPPLPGGLGSRSGDTTVTPRGARWTPTRCPPARGRRQGPPDRSINQETRTRGQKSRDGAPRGARAFARGRGKTERLVRHSVLHPLDFSRRQRKNPATAGSGLVFNTGVRASPASGWPARGRSRIRAMTRVFLSLPRRGRVASEASRAGFVLRIAMTPPPTLRVGPSPFRGGIHAFPLPQKNRPISI
jgi:hypothetical protein